MKPEIQADSLVAGLWPVAVPPPRLVAVPDLSFCRPAKVDIGILFSKLFQFTK